MRRTILALALLGTGLAARPAHALHRPGAMDAETGLHVARGASARAVRTTANTAPERTRAAWEAFRRERGSAFTAYFDAATGVPGRIYGGHIDAPGSVASAELAERYARDVLARHVELLAPGAKPEDFVLVSNHLGRGMRTVAFVQQHGGLRVLDGQVSFRFKNDRLFVIGSEALPDVAVEPVRAPVSAKTAQANAAAWLARDLGADAVAVKTSGPVILPLVRQGRTGAEYYTALEVEVRATSPIGRWTVWVDRSTGAPIARKQQLKFADGTVQINAPERWPGATRNNYPAPNLQFSAGGQTLITDAQGLFSWMPDGPIDVTANLSGPLVRVINNASRTQLTTSFTLDPGATYVWDRSSSEREDAQLVTYVASHTVKARSKVIAPEMSWLDTNQLQANVNMTQTCNAFSDGETINFFIAGDGCENTGRLPDVIYHEFGHAFHFHAIIQGAGQFDDSLSEGAGDYLSATTVNDNGMGRGFFFNDQPLRDIDEPNRERTWPDDIAQDPHETGMIFAGAMWDLRKSMVETLGQDAGVAYTDRLYFEILQRAVDIPSSYTEALAADDDDGDLSNGTPNICAINDAFALHGLADGATAGPGVGSPTNAGLVITLPVRRQNQCPGSEISGATLTWQLRSMPSVTGTIPMAVAANGADYTATIPPQRDGEVVELQVQVTLGSGSRLTLPDNLADPRYQIFLGEVTPLYCTSFEGDPAAEGWTHALTAGQASQGADDWMFGAPAGTPGSGDPSAAFDGTNVAGNDLGGGNFNGMYQSSKTNVLTAPEIDTMGFANVRLQYRRWLTVEDGFYDHASIISNGTTVWQNAASDQNGGLPHLDKEWRFQDVDLSSTIQDGRVQVKFQLESDQGLEFGGWTIDDFCVVGFGSKAPTCGNGTVEEGEACDDGNLVSGDGCENDCTVTPRPAPVCGNGQVEDGEQCDDGNTTNGDGCEANCTPTPVMTPVCGNGVVEAGEACDDGKNDGTACTNACQLPSVVQNPGMLDQANGAGCSCSTEAHQSGAPLFTVALLAGLVLSLRIRRKK